MDDIKKHRDQIDSIDRAIIDLLAQRMSHVKNIGMIKKDQDIAPFDDNRWQAVLNDRIEFGKQLGLSMGMIKHIWNSIHEHALEIEKSNE